LDREDHAFDVPAERVIDLLLGDVTKRQQPSTARIGEEDVDTACFRPDLTESAMFAESAGIPVTPLPISAAARSRASRRRPVM
jgi:hypothetical protein